MRPHVIILNGPAGVGKTTVGWLLAALAPDGVCIHGDVLRDFVVRRTNTHIHTGLAYVNGATMAANYLRAGYERVVFEFVFEQHQHVARFLDAFDSPHPVRMFTLWSSLETVLAREQARPDRERLGERVAACYRTLEQNLGHLGTVVLNEGRSAAEVAHTIHGLCSAGSGTLRSER